MIRDRVPPVEGSVQVYTVDELHHWTQVGRPKHNNILFEWGALLGNLLLRKGLNYGIAGLYFEFENALSPGDPVVAPSLSRDADQGIAYYDGLAGSSDRDYLRVPIIGGRLDISDEIRFPKGNTPVFFAQTSGTEGVHGKPFSSVNNSTVFGGALVAFVDDADPTQDLIFSRFYADVDEQVVKLATTQIGYEWTVRLK